jgi:hypothetical protein
MAEKIVKGVDIVEKGALSEHIEQAKQLLVVYSQLDVEVKSTATSLAKISKGFKATKTGDIGTAKATSDNMTKAMLEQERIAQAQIRTKKSLLQLEKLQEQQANRTAKAIKDEGNAYKQQSKTLTDLINRYQNLAARGRENGKVAKGMLAEINKLDAGLKKIDATVGRHQRNVGNYTSALKGIRGVAMGVTNALGKLGIAFGIGMIVNNVIGVFKDFEQESTNLAGILGKTRGEITKLTDDAKRLGASTKFTAAEVVQMQTAFAKLGFSEDQILNATEATLQLAAAVGTDLDNAATVVASTLNGFSLSATQTQRVVDVMAKSFDATALDVEKFSVAMATVAPVAQSAGFSVERTTAMLGALVDAGLDASKAGTGLRNIFLELQKQGLTFEQAMSKINKSANKGATAIDLFGKEGSTASLILAGTTEKVNGLEKSLMNAGGAAEKVANNQLDTLTGSLTTMSSAWEGFVLSLEDGDGIIARVLRGAIDLTTEFLEILTRLNETSAGKETRVQNAAKGGGQIAADATIKRIKELEELSNAELEVLAKTNGEAKLILTLRKQGLSLLEREAIVMSSLIRQFQEQVDLQKQTGTNGFGVFSSQTQQNISGATGQIETFNAELEKTFSLMSSDDLQKFVDKSENSASTYARTAAAMAKLEIARRNDSKASLEAQEEMNGSIGRTNKELSEMAKLEAQLSKIQLERSNLIIKQGGKESDRTLELKIQERTLQAQIDRYKEIIEQANKLERVAPREVTTTGGKMTSKEQADKMVEDAERKYQYFLDEKQKKEEKRIQDQINLAQDLTDITTFLTDRRIEAIDREIEAEKKKEEASKQRMNEIIAMRELDSNSLAQSLAFEKAEQAKALAEQEKLQRKKQRLELFNTAVNLMNSQIAQGNGEPLARTMADVSALMGFIRSLPMFWEGTDTTVGDAVGTKFSNGRDGILARVDKSEMILNKSKVDKLAAMGIHSTDEVVKRLMLGGGITNTPTSMVSMNDNSDVVNELAEHKALLKQLVNKPTTSTTMEQMGSVVTIVEKMSTPKKSVETIRYKKVR